MTLLYGAGSGLARFCFSNLGRLEVTGREAVPPFGPLIVVSNHLSFTDPPLLTASIPRPLYFICRRELYGNLLGTHVLPRFHVFPFDEAGLRVDTVRLMLRMLAEDRAVVVFPEGHRSPDHTLKAGLLGVVYLALKSQAPILPVGLTGTEKIKAWRMPVPLCRLSANIGQPFTLPIIEGRPNREVMASLLDLIMTRIADLLPERYRGAYSTSDRSPSRAAAPGRLPPVPGETT